MYQDICSTNMVMHLLYLILTSWAQAQHMYNWHCNKTKVARVPRLHSRHDMHPQQRRVYAYYQLKATAYPHAELQSFSRMLLCSVYCSKFGCFACVHHLDICKTTGYRACRRWHRNYRTPLCQADIGPDRTYFHTEISHTKIDIMS